MDSWAEHVLAMAKRLPRADRLRIAEALRQQANDAPTTEPPTELSDAWKDEVVRRVQAFRRGELKVVDGEEAFRRVRAKHGR